MRSSITIVSLLAALAVAKPLRHVHQKKALVTELDVVVETDIVTVTEGAPAKPTPVVVQATPSAPAIVAPQKQVVENPPAPHTSAKAAPSSQAAPSPSPASSPAPSTNGLTDFQAAAVNAHNAHRSNHSVGALTWNDTLATAAANNAKKCVFAHDSAGQNLNIFGQKPFPGSIDIPSVVANSITEGWYNGEFPTFHAYGVANPVSKRDDPWLHFTQVIWKDTTSVGCAVQHCQAGTANPYESVYTVCNYYPDGNFLGSFDKNVFKPQGDKTITAKIIMS